ncbi:MAG: hypothetical protein P8179_22360 [Candidatus Thiodiazotropha sp.]
MSVKWKNGFTPDVILGKLKAIRTLDGEKASFSGFEYNEYIQVLKSMIDVDASVSQEIARRLIAKGFHEAAKKQVLTPNSVISAVKKVIREHLGKPNEPYWLLTTLNINFSNDLPSYSINGCSIRFYKHLPTKYRKARANVLSEVSSWLIDRDESFSYFVVAHVSDKTAHEAVEKMLDAIDLLRGIWNLHINKSMVLSLGGRKTPINQITLGALHTLHNKKGERVNDAFWYEPEHYKNHSKVDFSKNSYKTLTFTKNVRKALRTNSYGKDVESAIIRYVRALDSQDYNAVFIKLWSVLEGLTHTLKDSYDKTIKRAAFHYSDREYNRQVLEHLRQYRNRSVHFGAGENDIDTHVYQLKSYVEQLLRFHIANQFKFENMEEAARFMDLQPDKVALKKQIALCQAGIKFMGG